MMFSLAEADCYMLWERVSTANRKAGFGNDIHKGICQYRFVTVEALLQIWKITKNCDRVEAVKMV